MKTIALALALALTSTTIAARAQARPTSSTQRGTIEVSRPAVKAVVAGPALLHGYSQFRGGALFLAPRVTGTDADSPARSRLAAIAETHDGFALSQLDLEQRREGDGLDKNPLFQDGDLLFNGIIIREIPEIDVRLPVTYATAGSGGIQVAPTWLCGQSALAWCWGRMPQPIFVPGVRRNWA